MDLLVDACSALRELVEHVADRVERDRRRLAALVTAGIEIVVEARSERLHRLLDATADGRCRDGANAAHDERALGIGLGGERHYVIGGRQAEDGLRSVEAKPP